MVIVTRTYVLLAGALALSACTVPLGGAGNVGAVRTGELPEAVRAMAAPGQDLATARLRSEDNCYWYDHAGPVETTPIPLRSVGGAQICLQRPA